MSVFSPKIDVFDVPFSIAGTNKKKNSASCQQIQTFATKILCISFKGINLPSIIKFLKILAEVESCTNDNPYYYCQSRLDIEIPKKSIFYTGEKIFRKKNRSGERNRYTKYMFVYNESKIIAKLDSFLSFSTDLTK